MNRNTMYTDILNGIHFAKKKTTKYQLSTISILYSFVTSLAKTTTTQKLKS